MTVRPYTRVRRATVVREQRERQRMGTERRGRDERARVERIACEAVQRGYSAARLGGLSDDGWQDVCLSAGVLFEAGLCSKAVDLVAAIEEVERKAR